MERSAEVRMQVSQIQELVKGKSDQFFPKGERTPPKGVLQESSWGVVQDLGFEGQTQPARGERTNKEQT